MSIVVAVCNKCVVYACCCIVYVRKVGVMDWNTCNHRTGTSPGSRYMCPSLALICRGYLYSIYIVYSLHSLHISKDWDISIWYNI